MVVVVEDILNFVQRPDTPQYAVDMLRTSIPKERMIPDENVASGPVPPKSALRRLNSSVLKTPGPSETSLAVCCSNKKVQLLGQVGCGRIGIFFAAMSSSQTALFCGEECYYLAVMIGRLFYWAVRPTGTTSCNRLVWYTIFIWKMVLRLFQSGHDAG